MNPEPNEAVYWRQVADSRLATIYQERDAKRDLQARLDALEAEHGKLTADYYALQYDLRQRKNMDTLAAFRRQERAERYAQAYYERRQDPEAVWVDRRTEAGL